MRSNRATQARLIALALLLTTPSGVRAADAQFTTVQVDLNSGALSQGLPFDVRFLLTGPVDAAVQEVRIEFSPRTCKDSTSLNQWNSDALPWRSLGLAPAPASGASPKFTILMPPFEVNRNYCLRFTVIKAIGGAELDNFRAAASAAVSSALNGLLTTANLTIDQLSAVRDGLNTAIKMAAPSVSVRPIPRSIFDETIPIQTFARGATALLQAQLSTSSRAGALRSTIDGLVADGIRTLATDTDFGRIANAAQTAAAGSDDFAAFRSAAATAKLWAGRSQEMWRQLADPTNKLSPSDLLTWGSNDAAGAVQRLAVVEEDFRAIRTLFEGLNTRAPFRTAAGVSVDSVQNVLAEIRRFVGDPVANDLGALGDEERRLTDLQTVLKTRETLVTAITGDFVVSAATSLVEDAVTTADFATRHSWYVSADIGVAIAARLYSGFAYSGANIYFRPVNKEAPLSQFPTRGRLARSVSAMIGITLTDLAKTGQRSNLIGSQMLVAGGGIRVTESLRVNAGAVFFLAEDTNPTVSHQKFAASPFLSFSYDADVAGAMGALGRLLPK
jgi:hypothetical protein